ncbi:unnamed protein product [Linum tenue]|uniref:Uncharacterized protein n=1 Tax=Linum tenue TaxID=586396 RepID=A0AAV0MBS7_9ROSI|nr:unnamed protein product [Linum tenue]
MKERLSRRTTKYDGTIKSILCLLGFFLLRVFRTAASAKPSPQLLASSSPRRRKCRRTSRS